MKAVDGTYRGFLITCDEDILELKHMIQNYKPISPNDIAFLQQKLKRKGHTHLVKLFNKIIIGKDVTQKSQASASQPKKKKIVPEKETCQTKVYKASDFRFLHNEIRVGDYRLNTERAFVIPNSILKNIEGEFVVRIRSNKTFYFENHGLTQLLNSVEEYCHSYLDKKCETWFMDEINSIKKNVRRELWLCISDFVLNEKNSRYELKDSSIKYSPLSKELLRHNFNYYVNRVSDIPSTLKDSYKRKFTYAKHIDKFNDEFRTSFANVLRKYIYYTQESVDNNYSPLIILCYKLVDEDSGRNITEYIYVDSLFYSQQIELEFIQVPQGVPYGYNEETIRHLKSQIELLKHDKLYNLLYANLQSVITKNSIEVILKNYSIGSYAEHSLGSESTYKYIINDRLLDISDEHYMLGHPRIEEYVHKLQMGYINRIAYFHDPNYMYSQEFPGKSVECYLLANDEYIALYALDYTKSTYVFKVKKGCVDIAMFLIWAYFSSRIYNKRQGKTIYIERLFSYFGIEWYDNTGSPISKNKDGLYQFILPCRFY